MILGLRKDFILVLLAAILAVQAGADTSSDDEPSLDEQALAYLEDHAKLIAAESRRLNLGSPPILRNAGGRLPVLTALGPVDIHMAMDDVMRVLGNPTSINEAPDNGLKWSYTRRRAKKVIIVFDSKSRVIRIFSTSDDFQIPRRLSVGMLLEDFEMVYGGRRVRKSEVLSRQLKLVKYPFSNLAIVVDTENGFVHALMVFDREASDEG